MLNTENTAIPASEWYQIWRASFSEFTVVDTLYLSKHKEAIIQ
jgi:hypothetical protein